ncbi:hypothetical protein [Chryseobacterium paridis]|uniref:YD repeat-containing protein n=1 Tax=Chryseobacterium paridis TaxID=2800328 RepID=A0ABS1FXQ2_9FLAO|nr:hypothetical protein [Chryseobacterium paridis]MBK1897033.1 hypothetical protein [Chryseobacterium paridis]
MRNIFLIIALMSALGCNGQKNNVFNSKAMKTFSIKKFEDNKGKQGFPDEYRYRLSDNSEARELDVTSDATQNIKTYQREITKEFSPFQYIYTYYDNGMLQGEITRFNDSGIEIKDYDKSGKIIKEINFDKSFTHSFGQIRDIVLKEKKIDINDTRQAVALRYDTPNASIKKYYQINVLNSKLIDGEWLSKPEYSFIIDDATGKEWKQKEIATPK